MNRETAARGNSCAPAHHSQLRDNFRHRNTAASSNASSLHMAKHHLSQSAEGNVVGVSIALAHRNFPKAQQVQPKNYKTTSRHYGY